MIGHYRPPAFRRLVVDAQLLAGDFLSRTKTNALEPGMGRTLIARVSTDF